MMEIDEEGGIEIRRPDRVQNLPGEGIQVAVVVVEVQLGFALTVVKPDIMLGSVPKIQM